MKKVFILLTLSLWIALPVNAQFMQGDDPLLVLPEVFIGFDSSGSMLWGTYPGLGSCDLGYGYNDPDYCYCSTGARCNTPGLNWCRNAPEGRTWHMAKYLPDGQYYWFPCDVYECNSGGKSCKVMCDVLPPPHNGSCALNYCDQFGSSGVAGDDGVTCFRNRWESAREILTGAYKDRNMNCQNQDQNGILDLYKENIRFGFSSFDDRWQNDHDYYTNGTQNWDYGDDLANGRRLGMKDRCPCDSSANSPVACNCAGTATARNIGRLIDVVKPDAPEDFIGNNQRVQAELCAMNRKNDGTSVGLSSLHQSTPLAPMLYDIDYYLAHYQTEINVTDPLGSCRPRFAILFTDGQENVGSDASVAGCAYTGGSWTHGTFYGCAARQAQTLCDHDVPVFVVGFGDPYSLGCPSNDPLDPTCKINRIAIAGTTGACNPSDPPLLAFMANDPAVLFAKFQAVMNAILAGAASRTEVASVPSLMSTDRSYAYSSFFTVSLAGGWQGHLIRTPIVDSNNDGIPEWDVANSIDFASVYYNQNPDDVRGKIYQVVNDPRSLTFSYPNQMPRPVSNDPDVGLYPLGHGGMHDAPAEWMCGTCETEGDDSDDDVDENATKKEHHKFVDYISGKTGAKDCAGNQVGTGHPVLGDIFHSNPQVVPPPSAIAPDYKYELYFLKNANRPTMVYVGANDGMLHAFVGEDPANPTRVGKQLWGFIPAALLAKIHKLRQGHDFFVDGTPVIRDVYFNNIPATDKNGNPIKDASNNPVMGAYRTVLVSGLRGGGNAYFALDVTDPDNPKYLWEFRTELEPTDDYKAKQCEAPRLQTWARPIIGQVWLKNARAGLGTPPEPDFVRKSVVIFPGGYFTPQSMMNIKSCIDFMSLIATSNSLFVLDIETGKLLRKFVISNSIPSSALADLQNYYDIINGPNPSQSWSGSFSSSDWSGGNGWGWGNSNPINDDGWFCREERDHANVPLSLPAQLQSNCQVTEDSNIYQMGCCLKQNGANWDTVDFSSCNFNAVGWCFYEYTYFKSNGSSQVKFKGAQCDGGSFNLQVGRNFAVESVAANPVAYSTAFGEYISRTFIPTTTGKIWRVNLSSAMFDPLKPEGQMVYAYTDGNGVKHDWDVSRDINNNPIPWFDTRPYTGGVPRPITVQPALAMNAARNLVLFVGTGRIDDLSYTNTRDYFLAVEETRTLSADGFYLPDPTGKLFCNETYGASCAGSGMPKMLGESERLFGKPLVVSGQVFFTTFQPSSNQCDSGTGRVYGYRYDDFQQDMLTNNTMADKGPPRQPQVVWTPKGAQLVTGQGSTIQIVQTREQTPITTGAQVLSWGKVL